MTEGCRVQDYDLLTSTHLNPSLTASGQGRALRGVIVKNTEQVRSNKVFLNCRRIEQHICSNIQQQGAAEAVAVKEMSVAAGWRKVGI